MRCGVVTVVMLLLSTAYEHDYARCGVGLQWLCAECWLDGLSDSSTPGSYRHVLQGHYTRANGSVSPRMPR